MLILYDIGIESSMFTASTSFPLNQVHVTPDDLGSWLAL